MQTCVAIENAATNIIRIAASPQRTTDLTPNALLILSAAIAMLGSKGSQAAVAFWYEDETSDHPRAHMVKKVAEAMPPATMMEDAATMRATTAFSLFTKEADGDATLNRSRRSATQNLQNTSAHTESGYNASKNASE